MKNETPHTQHAIDYIEFTVHDLGVAKEFYAKAFDWQFTDYGPEYVGIKGEHRDMGGFAKGETKPGGVLVILFSEQLDETLAAVRNAGGNITKEPFAFPGGRRFHFADPSGNELAVWTPALAPTK
jgi:predicted enzyme related to lactoylglutathione lyase